MGFAVAAAGKIINNRAVGAVIPRTGVRELQQLFAHRLQFDDVAFNFGYLFQGAFFHVRAVTLRIVEQVNQLAALFQIKPDLSCLAQQRQLIQMQLGVAAVAVFTAQRRRYQPLLFIKADRFAG